MKRLCSVFGLVLSLGMVVEGATPALFPNMTRAYFPRGSAQLVKPYLPKPTGSSKGYRLVVEAPAWLEFVTVEPSLGRPPQGVAHKPGTTRAGVKYVQTVLNYDLYPGQGFELSICWLDGARKTLNYRPAVTAGGTFGWSHLVRTVTAPPKAAFARPILIKWQNRDIRGTFWVDNVTICEAGKPQNLLPGGTFDDPNWKSPYFKAEGPGGSRCAKFVCPAEQAARQQALWLTDAEHAVPVREGSKYSIALDLKTEGVETPMAQPIVALLFRAAASAPVGRTTLYTGVATDAAPQPALQASELVILPPLKNIRPKTVRIAPCLYAGEYEPRVAAAYARNLWESGMTWAYGSVRNNIVTELWPRGLRVWMAKPGEPFEAHGAVAAEFLRSHPETGATRFDGKPRGGLFCPTWLLSAAGADMRRAMEQELIDAVRRDGYTAVDWDIEQTVIGSAAGNDPDRGFCLCPRCLEAFRRVQQIASQQTLDAEAIRGKYREAWVTFRCRQNADLVGHAREALRRCGRPIEFSVYSGYQGQQTREWYGVDWRLLSSKIDLAICGYGGTRKALRDTREALGATPLMGGENYFLSPEPPTHVVGWMIGSLKQTPRPEHWRNRLLRQFADGGCRGVLIWYLPTMEGGAFYYTSEAAQMIADHEDLFCRGRRCDERFAVAGLKPEHWAAFEHQGERLLMLLSFSDKPQVAQVKQSQVAAGCRATVYAEKSEATISPVEFSLPLAPWEAKLIRFSRR